MKKKYSEPPGCDNTKYAWQFEKSREVVSSICSAIKVAKRLPGSEDPLSIRQCLLSALSPALWNATKIYCQITALRWESTATRWSPELRQYLFDHPEKCEETLALIDSEDYADNYYTQ